MRLLTVCVSLPKTVAADAGPVETGIFKMPVAGRVALHSLNIDGDRQADLRFHGGEHKAVYAYPVEHYAYWQEHLKRDVLPHGLFGENLTVEGMLEENVCIGDVFRIGTAQLQVTQPRVPCYKLGIKMGDPGFIKKFFRSRRSGFYLRVLEEGEIGAGDPVTLVHADPARLSIREIHEIHFSITGEADLEGVRRALAISALSQEWRSELEDILLRQT